MARNCRNQKQIQMKLKLNSDSFFHWRKMNIDILKAMQIRFREFYLFRSEAFWSMAHFVLMCESLTPAPACLCVSPVMGAEWLWVGGETRTETRVSPGRVLPGGQSVAQSGRGSGERRSRDTEPESEPWLWVTACRDATPRPGIRDETVRITCQSRTPRTSSCHA